MHAPGAPDSIDLVTVEAVEAAARMLDGIIRTTPTEHSHTFSRILGRPVFLKHEERQRTGSFKIRGAYHCIARLPEEQRARGVVAASAGNHAQGVALAATLLGVPSTIFMPEAAPYPKVDATRSYGAEVRLVGAVVDEALAAAIAHADEQGKAYIAPFDNRDVIAGQGTLGLEIAAEAPDARTVVVPVGGGGLIAGVATAVKARNPGTTVIGVEAAGAAAMSEAMIYGEPTALRSVDTMADGIAVRSVSALTLTHARSLVDDVVTVTEEQLSEAVLLLLERGKSVVEPAGAAGLAALLSGKVRGEGPVCVVLSGGNVDPPVLVRIVEHGLGVAGRYVVLRVRLTDRPGELARLLGTLADEGLNVLDVDHQRAGPDLGVDEVSVGLTLETRDPEHRDEIAGHLRRLGYHIPDA